MSKALSSAIDAADDTKGHGNGARIEDSEAETPVDGRERMTDPVRHRSSAGAGGDDSAYDNEQLGEHGNTLWEQMTAREGKDAAHRAGMRAGDWQAEMQLQEALRESTRDVDADRARAPSFEQSFVDAGFHALATSAVEGEEGAEEDEGDLRRDGDPVRGGRTESNTRTATGARSGQDEGHIGGDAGVQRAQKDGLAGKRAGNDNVEDDAVGDDDGAAFEVEQDEEFGSIEFVVTRDGGVVPVPSEAIEAEAAKRAKGGHARTGGKPPRAGAPGAKKAGRTKQRVTATGGVHEGRSTSVSLAPAMDSQRHAPTEGRLECEDWGHDGRQSRAGESKEKEGKTVGGGREGEEAVDEQEGEERETQEDVPLPPDIVLTLSDDVLHRTLLFLHPEDIFECRAVSSRWTFPGHEAVFEGLCRRTYLAQSAKKLLNVKRWRSWQRMYKLRPRLRDSGMYSLKTSYFKKPVRDMSTTWVPGTILEVTYYRYFRFFGDGRVAYGLMHESPPEFVRLMQEGSPKVSYGTYTISKWDVSVEVTTAWATVNFRLQLANGERGRFTHLVLLSHSSVPLNDSRAGRCHHRVKSSDFFTFRRVWQF